MSFAARPITETTAPKERRAAVPTGQWLAPMTAMMFVLGLFIALALRSASVGRPGGIPGVTDPSSFQGTSSSYWIMKSNILQLKEQIRDLQDDNHKLSMNSTVRAQTREELQAARMAAGLTSVHGPGVEVVLNDSAKRPPAGIPSAMNADLTLNYIIHDVDIQRVVNELRIGGAENIAINDERLVGSSAIRCVGPSIQVNNNPLTPPFRIRAIGDPNKLIATLSLPGGIREQLNQADPAMITVSPVKDMTLPAYDGVTFNKYSHAVDQSGPS